jgi:hypothetical protein
VLLAWRLGRGEIVRPRRQGLALLCGPSTSPLDGMAEFFQAPAGIKNVPHWEEECRRVHARATDFIAGKLTVVQAALALSRLELMTRAKGDADFEVFRKISGELLGLPVGEERRLWAKQALDREDVKIAAIERRWKRSALAAARRLAERYRWALAARQHRRRSGHAV